MYTLNTLSGNTPTEIGEKELLTLATINNLSYIFRNPKPKNKGIKRKLRGFRHHIPTASSVLAKQRINIHDRVSEIIKAVIPSEYIQRETASNIYILCPFHYEKTASLSIAKHKCMAKCFGCGKSFSLETFLSIILGQTQKYRQQALIGGLSPSTQEIEKQRHLFELEAPTSEQIQEYRERKLKIFQMMYQTAIGKQYTHSTPNPQLAIGQGRDEPTTIDDSNKIDDNDLPF